MASNDEMKILRVGVIQDGKMVEERLVRKRGDVTVGEDGRSTFVIPRSGFSGRQAVFVYSRGRYFLVFDDTASGRVTVHGQIRDIASLGSEEICKKKGDSWHLALDESSRGKVVIGAVTLLFQFVTPPPVVSRPQLPANVRGSWLTHLDMALLGIIVLSTVIQLGTAGGLHFWWETRGKYEVVQTAVNVREFLKVEVVEAEKAEEKQEKKKEEEDDDEEGGNEEKPIEKPVEEKKKKPKEKRDTFVKPKAKEAPKRLSKEERRNKVRQASALRFVTSASEDGTVKDTLSRGVAAKDMDAFDMRGVVVADSSAENRYRGGVERPDEDTSYRDIDMKDLRGPQAGKVDTANEKKQHRIKGNVLLSGKVKTKGGRVDKGGVASAIKRRRGAMTRCYESALKRNENAGGKLVVEFTVNARGRVTNAKVNKNSVGDSQVGACVLKYLKKVKFPEPEEGKSVTVRFPFMFARKN